MTRIIFEKTHVVLIVLLLGWAGSSAAGYYYPAAEIKSAVSAYIENQFRGRGQRFELNWINQINDVSLPNPPEKVEVTRRARGPLAANRVFRVTFYENGKAQKSIYVPVQIRVFQPVWVTRYAIRKGEVLDVDRLNLEEREITHLSGNPLPRMPGVARLMARRSLPAGRVVLQNDVREPYLVEKGNRVDVLFARGAVKIKIQTLAAQSGSRDDLIWVKNPKTRQRMRVRVVGSDQAVLP